MELDIIKLIEKSPITRLNNEYENKLINKIKDNFEEDEQKLFVGSFYCFLNYDSKKDFIIDFDSVWKWVGFTRKGDGKRLLEKHFIIEVDYKIKKTSSVTYEEENETTTIFRQLAENKKVETRAMCYNLK